MVLLNTERVTNDKEILSSALLESDFVFIFSLADGVYVTPPRAPCLSTEQVVAVVAARARVGQERERNLLLGRRAEREETEKWRKFRSRGTRGNWCILQAPFRFATRRGRASSACLEERFYRRRSRGKGDDRRPCK